MDLAVTDPSAEGHLRLKSRSRGAKLLPMMVRQFGQLSVVTVLAHEFGHAVQFRLKDKAGMSNNTPTIVKDTVLIGSAMKEGMTVKTSNNTKGLARAFDVRTGKLIWTFQTIAKPGEEGGDTWLNNSWSINGNTARVQ